MKSIGEKIDEIYLMTCTAYLKTHMSQIKDDIYRELGCSECTIKLYSVTIPVADELIDIELCYETQIAKVTKAEFSYAEDWRGHKIYIQVPLP